MLKNPFLYISLVLAGGLVWLYLDAKKNMKAKQAEIDALKKG